MTQFLVSAFLFIAYGYMSITIWHKFGSNSFFNFSDKSKRNKFWFFLASEIVGSLILATIVRHVWTGFI